MLTQFAAILGGQSLVLSAISAATDLLLMNKAAALPSAMLQYGIASGIMFNKLT